MKLSTLANSSTVRVASYHVESIARSGRSWPANGTDSYCRSSRVAAVQAGASIHQRVCTAVPYSKRLNHPKGHCPGWHSMTPHTTTNDGVRLAYDQYGDSGPVVVLIHGWSGSRKYFSRNIAEGLSNAKCRVYAYDQRFHGDSDSPNHGFHVARLAADLRDFLEALNLDEVTAVGTSMGCAVIWSYVELFGTRRLKQAVFVDQAPLQDPKPDWKLGSKGNPAQLARDMQQGVVGMAAVAAGNAESCLSLELPRDVQQLLDKETLQCDAKALGALMADHTQLDWRPVLPLLKIPCLNVVGGQSGIFPVEGCLEVASLAPDCCSVVCKNANHWLYLEQPAEFNSLLLDFVHSGNAGMEKEIHVC